MKQDVVADAEALKAGLQATGHMELKGIFFDTGKADLKPESEAALKEVARMLQQSGALKVWVVGHTDSVGTAESNLALSTARAASVVKYLTGTSGIAAKRLGSFGAGPYAPVALAGVLLETPELGIAGNKPGFAGDSEGCGETIGVGDGVTGLESGRCHGLRTVGGDQGDGKLIDDAHRGVPAGLSTGSLQCVEHLSPVDEAHGKRGAALLGLREDMLDAFRSGLILEVGEQGEAVEDENAAHRPASSLRNSARALSAESPPLKMPRA